MPWLAFGRAAETESRVALPLVGFEAAPSLDAFLEALGPSDSLGRLFAGSEEPTPGVDALRYWARAAAVPGAVGPESPREGLVVWNDGLALVEDGRPQCAVWHLESSFALDVPAGYDALELEYVPSPTDERHNRRRFAEWIRLADEGDDTSISTLVEIGGVFGNDSFKFRDLLSPKRLASGGFRVSLRVAGLPAKLFGGAVKTIGTTMYTEADGAFVGRLEHEERMSSDAATAIPRLTEDVDPPSCPSVAILVHGFASCAVPAARSLSKRGFADRIPTYRFEHDTFLWPRDNARALVELINQRLPQKRVLLICHSRGGLVARSAVAELPSRDVSIVTLGTPHEGTPIADSWALGARHALRIVNSYFYETQVTGGDPHPASTARGYLPRRFPPPGLDALLRHSYFLRDLAHDAPPGKHLTAFGGEFRPDESGCGFTPGGAIAASFASGLFGGEPNDIVVSTKSATAVQAGSGIRLTRSCTHFGYFADNEALTALDAAAAARCSAEASTSEIRAKQQRLKDRRGRINLKIAGDPTPNEGPAG